MSFKDNITIFNQELIEIVKINPWIYDKNFIDISDQSKEAMWVQIDEKLTSMGLDIKNGSKSRWKCLRDQFVRKDKMTNPSWIHYNEMLFLRPHISHRYGKNTTSSSSDVSSIPPAPLNIATSMDSPCSSTAFNKEPEFQHIYTFANGIPIRNEGNVQILSNAFLNEDQETSFVEESIAKPSTSNLTLKRHVPTIIGNQIIYKTRNSQINSEHNLHYSQDENLQIQSENQIYLKNVNKTSIDDVYHVDGKSSPSSINYSVPETQYIANDVHMSSEDLNFHMYSNNDAFSNEVQKTCSAEEPNALPATSILGRKHLMSTSIEDQKNYKIQKLQTSEEIMNYSQDKGLVQIKLPAKQMNYSQDKGSVQIQLPAKQTNYSQDKDLLHIQLPKKQTFPQEIYEESSASLINYCPPESQHVANNISANSYEENPPTTSNNSVLNENKKKSLNKKKNIASSTTIFKKGKTFVPPTNKNSGTCNIDKTNKLKVKSDLKGKGLVVPPMDHFAVKKIKNKSKKTKVEDAILSCSKKISSMTSDCSSLIKLQKKIAMKKLNGTSHSNKKSQQVDQEDGLMNLIEMEWISLSKDEQAELFPSILNEMVRLENS
ncbi:uncharacterized protein LOC122510542 [Leptopilina heterotoma]|uniref:uncharacterized protein LOC122498889 n=1 Tax=Leptopilina heterotoma TaxID=63436 RepID=UPI001CA8F714|nr:uncharacterized protein LOC122498889 [Leptopilina heterotoma]XP_043481225.1 uncharacterized protein LOC122510542 [Leptopilina heterotoma]